MASVALFLSLEICLLSITLENCFFQRNSFHLHSGWVLPTHLAHSTRPDSTKQIHLGKQCTPFKNSQNTEQMQRSSTVQVNHKILLVLFANQASYKVWNHFILVQMVSPLRWNHFIGNVSPESIITNNIFFWSHFPQRELKSCKYLLSETHYRSVS